MDGLDGIVVGSQETEDDENIAFPLRGFKHYIYSKEIDTYNSNQYGLREKLAIPIKPLENAFIGTLAWGLGWFIAPPGTPFSFGHFVDGEYD